MTSVREHLARFLAELIGTALLVFFGCMGCIGREDIPNNTLQTVVAFGLSIMVLITAFGCVSGAHINPAVSVAAFVFKLITIPMLVYYLLAQIVGAFLGFGLLKLLVPGNVISPPNSKYGLCTTAPHDDILVIQAVAIELLITGGLIFLLCGIWNPKNKLNQDSAPLKFGFAITALACVAAPWTGGSMNPARSLAPAIWNGDFKHIWIYWVGPLLGALLSSIFYRFLLMVDGEQDTATEA